MKRILVDSSVWISYFRSGNAHPGLDELIRSDVICTNELILAELLPYLHGKHHHAVVESLRALENVPLAIHWELIVAYQILNLKNGLWPVGIPDLILVDQAVSENLVLFSEDRHFRLMKEHISFSLLGSAADA